MSGGGRVVFGPAASALFDLRAPTAVSAGAGSGKTTALVELCVRLLSGEATGDPCDPGALAVVTFTDKAGEELVLRLRAAVAERARLSSGADAREEAEGARAPGSPAAAAWLERLHALDRMAVGTIHGFCGRLLREHAPEAGLDPEFAVVDEERAAAWLAHAARAAVVAALDAGRPAARALAAGLGAAAAAGGRGGLASLVADLVRARATRGARGPLAPAPAREDAAREAWVRLRAAAGAIVREGGAAGGSGAAGNGARALAEDVARAREALPAGEAAGPGDLAAVAALAEATKGKRLGKADGALREAKDALAAAARDVVALEAERLAAPQKAEVAALVADAEGRYAARKREARAVDFDDLLALARDLLARDPALRAELRGRFRALLVDEYQDVNGLQQELFEALAGPGDPSPASAPEGGAAGPLLVAVGDLKQSIYRFRGADVSVFARVVRGMAAGAGRVLHLSENHRSAPALLELVNETFARCMRPPEGAAPRDDEIAFRDEDRLVPTRGEGARPACELLEDPAPGTAAERRVREAEAVARRISAIVSGAAGVAVRDRGADGEGPPRRPSYGDVAILFRRLTQLGPYERALRAAGIPYRLARGGGFYQAPEVRDAGELLATLFDPGDATAWAALLRSPLCLVSDATLLHLARRDGGFPRLARSDPEAVRAGLRDAARLPADEGERLVRFLGAWQDLRAVRDRVPLPELLARAVEALDLDAALLAAPDGERRAVNLEKVLAIAARFEADGGRGAELARSLRSLAARPPREPEAELEAGDAVALLSVHQAKGLEWPVVLVPDLGARARSDGARALLDGEGRLCLALVDAAREAFVETAALRDAREADRRAAAAESRRLLYVALTRARDHLVLSGEAANGPKDGTWRGLVEAAASARPDLVRRVRLADAGTSAAGPALPAPPPPAAPALARLRPPRLAPPAPVSAIRVAVTDLAEYARCPRRHHLGRFLALPEPRGAARAPADDPGRATVRGTLAHAMLSETDLAAPPLERRAQLAAAAARRGHDPASAGVRRILAEVARFADSEAGRALAAAAREGRLSREAPFLLRLPGGGGTAAGAGERAPDVYLVGAIDALVLGRRGEPVTVVDYKYATARPGAAERYRIQLLAYALAAGRAHPGARVRARLQFLRGDLRAVDLTPSEAELAAFAREAPALAWEAHRGAGDRPPAELGREEARCRAEGCGFVSRCFAAARRASRDGERASEGFSPCLAAREVSTLRPASAGPT